MEPKRYLVDPKYYSEISHLIDHISSNLQEILKDKLVGIYVFGSLMDGDFEYGTSDIDLMVALSSQLNQKEYDEVKRMHDDITNKYYKNWDDKVETIYISTKALKTFRTERSQIAVINPGELFHLKDAGIDWLINWYEVLKKGISVYGPQPQLLIDPISKDEFIEAVKKQVKDWRKWIHNMHKRKQQAYAILTMCRALYTFKNGEQVSKKQAALWTAKELPQWANLIENALEWRNDWKNEQVDHEATFPETLKFTNFVIDQIVQ